VIRREPKMPSLPPEDPKAVGRTGLPLRLHSTKEARVKTAERRLKIPELHAAGLFTWNIAAHIFGVEKPSSNQLQMVRNDLATLGLRANRKGKPPGQLLCNDERYLAKKVAAVQKPREAAWEAADESGLEKCLLCRGSGHGPRKGQAPWHCEHCKGQGWRRVRVAVRRIPAEAFARVGCALSSPEADHSGV
jgi:hypothetical protein